MRVHPRLGQGQARGLERKPWALGNHLISARELPEAWQVGRGSISLEGGRGLTSGGPRRQYLLLGPAVGTVLLSVAGETEARCVGQVSRRWFQGLVPSPLPGAGNRGPTQGTLWAGSPVPTPCRTSGLGYWEVAGPSLPCWGNFLPTLTSRPGGNPGTAVGSPPPLPAPTA